MDKEQDINMLIKENEQLKQRIQNLEDVLSKNIKIKEKLINDSNIQSKELVKVKEENIKYLNTIEELNKQIKNLQHIKKEQNKQIEQYISIKESMQQSVKELKNKLDSIKDEYKKIESKNSDVVTQIDELLNEYKNLENYLETTKNRADLTDIKIDSKLFLKGKFINFDHEESSLEIQINNKSYFYPLSSYRCKYLPMFNSRVLIFLDEIGTKQIYGLDKGSIIELALTYEFIVKSIIPSNNQIKLYNTQFGYINVDVDSDFFKKRSLKLSKKILLKQIIIDAKDYFCMMDDDSLEYDAKEILKYIKGN